METINQSIGNHALSATVTEALTIGKSSSYLIGNLSIGHHQLVLQEWLNADMQQPWTRQRVLEVK